MAPWQQIIAALVLLVSSTFGLVLPKDPELQRNFLEGDMALSPLQTLVIENPLSRNGLLSSYYRWPEATIFYTISPNFGAAQRNAILEAIDSIAQCSCIKFRQANSTTPYFVNVTNYDKGCYSYVGFQRRVQELNLEPYPVGYGCFRKGTIIHEFLHALGLFHQQSATDRDVFVDIKLENIVEGTEYNFRKYPDSVVSSFGIPYDYESVLHYPKWAFSKNGLDTIVPKDKAASIGQRVGLSRSDIQKINRMYSC